MIGAILGDIIGSPYEFTFYNIKTKDFPLFCEKSKFTDDTVHTLAIGNAIMRGYKNEELTKEIIIDNLHFYTRRYHKAGYGRKLYLWVARNQRHPYNSYGNGSAMRVSPVALTYNTLEEVQKYAIISAEVTHNHPEGIKGAVATASAIFLARTSCPKEMIKEYINENFDYNLQRSLEEMRINYIHDESCQNSVPQAITAFLLSTNYEDCIRNAVSLDGDSDTIAAIAGSIAYAFYKVIPENILTNGYTYLDDFICNEIKVFNNWIETKSRI